MIIEITTITTLQIIDAFPDNLLVSYNKIAIKYPTINIPKSNTPR
jgi:hypothetical protein